MFYLLHGDHHVESRIFLSSLIDKAKKDSKEVIQLNGEIVALNDLIQATQSDSMFGGYKLVVIENLFSRRKSKDQTDILAFTKSFAGDIDIIFWEKKSIGKILQRSLPAKTTVKEFKLPALIFKLVEQINPKEKSQAIKTLDEALKIGASEFIFAMVVRQIKLLLEIKLGKVPTGAPWIVGKLKSQATSFTQEQLESAYKKLYQIDKQIKTGTTPMDLSWHLGYWIASI